MPRYTGPYLSTPCAVSTCRHPYNWHPPGGLCSVPECPCIAYATPAPKKEAPMPGGITVTRDDVYTLRPYLDSQVILHVQEWRARTPIGTVTTVDRMLNCAPGCGCPPDTLLAACKGDHGHGMALEVVMDILNPQDAVCAVPGVVVHTATMPFRVEAVPLV